MMGCNINLSRREKVQVKTALVEFMKTLSDTSKPPYQIAMNKVNSNDFYGDGIFMRCMENSLEYKFQQTKSPKALALMGKIVKTRETFQREALKHILSPKAKTS